MEGVLNLSAFGDIIENPKKKMQNQETTPPVRQDDPHLSGRPDFDDFTFDKFRKLPQPIQKEDNKKIQNEVACKVLKNASQVKLFHWQTSSYAEHKALDKFFSNFLDLSDSLMESLMGKYGRPVLDTNSSTLEMTNYSSQNMDSFMDRMHECYSKEIKGGLDAKNDSELINIIDEILALITKTKYLLSLK